MLISSNSATSAFAFLPADIAAPISVVNNSVVAKSPLLARHNLSGFPGSPTNLLSPPHTLQCPTDPSALAKLPIVAMSFSAGPGARSKLPPNHSILGNRSSESADEMVREL